MKLNIKSRKGFTLIELLVVIGILAVLAAIAIPSVAGLIDRANVSADNTNANEYTNAIERFTSEYELYCQDIASGIIKDENGDGKPDSDLDSAQGRVYNVTGAVTRADITALESAGHGDKQINRDTKYPVNTETLESIIVNYTKTSSATFEPKQSDCSFWYNPDCGVVVVAKTNASYDDLNKLIASGMDAKGNSIEGNENWTNVTETAVKETFDYTISYDIQASQNVKEIIVPEGINRNSSATLKFKISQNVSYSDIRVNGASYTTTYETIDSQYRYLVVNLTNATDNVTVKLYGVMHWF